ncbi:MAG: ABC transporter ATP-binding protein [Bacteroidetes bacterium GWF2_33_16]|nr:MAG: ABC transporter ATP-binding protein [Bacteroidetes bacterium GWE2_32_14]OFY07839.1 MAG: ABC transporter ATP-binding protein [Bacteroidetes bacterium GWF2_33_16]
MGTEENISSFYNNENVIEISHLKKSFDTNLVLKDISMTVKKGENVVVLGKSGIGKSVLIKCIVRLIQPDEGSIKVFGEEVTTMKPNELNELRTKIGFIFQGNALYDSMTVRENLEFPLRRNKVIKDPKLIDELIHEALENVGLLDTMDKMPAELSGGMKKRIGLARTLILRPEIILYDEPTTGLDPLTSREISNLIVEIQTKYKASSIVITHDLNCAKITSNRMLILQDGVFIAKGTFNELKNSENDWVKSYFKIE